MTKSDDFDFEDLVGEEFDFFYGASERFFKLDDTIYEAIEDDDSMEVIISEGPKQPTFGLPIARVVLERDDNDDEFVGYKLTDLHDEHCWLRIGTDYSAPWHVQAIFDYTPKDLDHV